MARRKLWLKIGAETPRLVDEGALRDSVAAGVVPETALAGERVDDLRPLATILSQSKGSPRGGRGKIALVVAALGIAGLAVGGGATWMKTRPPPLCASTPTIVRSATSTVTVRVFATRRIKAIDAEAKVLERLLKAMKAESQGRLDYHLVDVEGDYEAGEAIDAGLTPRRLETSAPDDSAELGLGYCGVVISYGAERAKIPWIAPGTDQASAEFWIVNKLREAIALGDRKTFRVGVLVGHHEIAIGDANMVVMAGGSRPSMRDVITQNFPYYQFVDVDLKGGSAPVDPELHGLLVTQPGDDLTEPELRRIDEFVMKGRTLAIFASAASFAAGDGHMRSKLSTHGLERLTSGYGLGVGKDLLFDPKASFRTQVAASTAPGELAFDYLPIPTDATGLDSKSVLFSGIAEVGFPLASSIDVVPAAQPGATFTVLAKTSPAAIRDRSEERELDPAHPPHGSGDAGTWTMAATVSGKLKSAFGGATSAAPARVAVIASSHFFANPFARAALPSQDSFLSTMMGDAPAGLTAELASPYTMRAMTSAILAFKNTLDWLTSDEDLSGCLPTTSADKKK